MAEFVGVTVTQLGVASAILTWYYLYKCSTTKALIRLTIPCGGRYKIEWLLGGEGSCLVALTGKHCVEAADPLCSMFLQRYNSGIRWFHINKEKPAFIWCYVESLMHFNMCTQHIVNYR